MRLTRTYKFKLYRSKKNRHLHQQLEIAGLVYNHCIALHRRYYRLSGKSLGQYDVMRHLTKLKKLPRYTHWNLVGSQAIQDVVQRIDRAYKLFFGNLKRKARCHSWRGPGVKKSHNWHKAKAHVARIYQRVVNRRRDWFFKLAHELTDRYDHLFFEDLAMRGMQMLWGRKVGDLARAEFINIVRYVAAVKGKVVHLINRFFPSSQMCAACRHIQKLGLSARRWVCSACGVVHDRDHNAAVNILREGASSLGLGNVSPPRAAIAV